MRIALDGLGMQSGSRHRGIGRYLRHLVEALAEAGHPPLVYADAGRDQAGIPRPLGVAVRGLSGRYQDRIEEVVAGNPDGADCLVIGSPFELHAGFLAPDPARAGLPLAAIAYDLIPHLFPAEYLPPSDRYAAPYRAGFERLLRYPRLLALSAATRADLIAAGVPGERVAVIGGATRPGFFAPGPADGLPHPLADGRPFVLCLGQHEPRKDPRAVIDAFAALPGPVRATTRLVVVCPSRADQAAALRDRFARLVPPPAAGMVLYDRHVPDEALRALYRGCAACCLPSRYEGFGLPLLEAMQCGAAVVAGRNSAQPEVAGDAAVLVGDGPGPLAEALAGLLRDRPRREDLGRRAAARGREFSWAKVAERFVAALGATDAPRPAAVAAAASDPIEALFPPAPHLAATFRSRVERGRAVASGASVAICALMRDLGDNFAAARAGVEAIAAPFAAARAYVYENDSADATADRLRAWAREDPALLGWHLCEALGHRRWPRARDLERAAAMAAARNRYRDALAADVAAGAFAPDFVVVLDTDLAGWSVPGLLSTLGDGGWDAVGANGLHNLRGRWTQYDAWAWRDPGHPHPHHHAEVNGRVFGRGEPLVPVLSCFGGMAIYRREAFLAARYAGGDCEHVPLHLAMARAGLGRIFCNPGMVALYR